MAELWAELVAESMELGVESKLGAYYDSIPEEKKYMLDKTLDFDHGGVQSDLGAIADSMDEWEGRVAEKLELTKAEIEAIKTKHPGELNKQARAALIKRQEKCGPSTTYRNLIITFVRASKGDCAEAVCRVLREKAVHIHKAEHSTRQNVTTNGEQCTSSLLRYAEYLKGVYEHASDEKIPKISCDEFIELSLVKKTRNDRVEFAETTLRGNIDMIMEQKEPIMIEDVLKPNEDQQHIKCVVVLGAPGIGKSTFALEFCRRWDRIEALKKYALVVLLRLREKRVQEIQKVADLFYHYDSDLQEAVAADVTKSEGKGLLLIFDGFDELPFVLRSKSIFIDIICGICLPHCTVIITSRPSAAADLYSVARNQIQKEIEILGFTQERIEKFATSVFASQPDVLEDFLKYMQSNPPIRSLMYIPLNGTIVTEIYRANITRGRPIPQTMTQLYSELCHVLLMRYLVDKGDSFADKLPEQLQDLPPQLYNPILALAKLAFDGIENEKLIFSKLPDECHGDHFGFMNASTELYMGHKARLSYNFLHLTLQEFLAAFYISQLPTVEQNFFEMIVRQWDIVGRFLAGLTGISNNWLMFFSKRKSKSVQQQPETYSIPCDIVQCLYELQSRIDYRSTFKVEKMEFLSSSDTTILDYYAVGQCIARSNRPWIVHICMGRNGNEALAMLTSGLNSSPTVYGSIEILVIEHNYKLDCAYLGKFPRTIQGTLSTLRLKQCQLDHSTLASLLPNLSRLEVLRVSDNPADNGGLVKLFTELANLKCMKELYVSGINLDIKDIHALAKVIKKKTSSVKTLSIGDKTMSSECVLKLLQVILAHSSLHLLILKCVTIEASKDAYPFRKIGEHLSELNLIGCTGEQFIMSNLADGLETNTGLKKLRIVHSSMDDTYTNLTDGFLALNKALKRNHNLQTISLHPVILKTLCSKWDSRVEWCSSSKRLFSTE